MHITVRGGTNAGWRTVRPTIKPWKCPNCGVETRYSACVVCNTPKPEE